MALWLVEQAESSSILYENCQRMRTETVYTKTHKQLKIIILDIYICEGGSNTTWKFYYLLSINRLT
jgi:hypothetical protein